MKYIIPILVLLAFPLQSKDTYIGLGMGIQDGLNGGKDAKEYGLTVGRKLNDLFAAEIYFLSKLPAEVNTSEVFQVIAMALILSFLASVYPAWRASRVLPAEVLRYE